MCIQWRGLRMTGVVGRPTANYENTRVAAAKRRARDCAATADGAAVGFEFAEVSCLADAARVWAAVWPGGFRCAGGEKLVDVARVYGTKGQQWENVDRI